MKLLIVIKILFSKWFAYIMPIISSPLILLIFYKFYSWSCSFMIKPLVSGEILGVSLISTAIFLVISLFNAKGVAEQVSTAFYEANEYIRIKDNYKSTLLRSSQKGEKD